LPSGRRRAAIATRGSPIRSSTTRREAIPPQGDLPALAMGFKPIAATSRTVRRCGVGERPETGPAPHRCPSCRRPAGSSAPPLVEDFESAATGGKPTPSVARLQTAGLDPSHRGDCRGRQEVPEVHRRGRTKSIVGSRTSISAPSATPAECCILPADIKNSAEHPSECYLGLRDWAPAGGNTARVRASC